MTKEFLIHPCQTLGTDSAALAALAPFQQVRRKLGIPEEFDSVSVVYILSCISPHGLRAAWKAAMDPNKNYAPEPESSDRRKLSKKFERWELYITPAPETDPFAFCETLETIVKEVFIKETDFSQTDLNVIFFPPLDEEGYAVCRTVGSDRGHDCSTHWMDKNNYQGRLAAIREYMGVPKERNATEKPFATTRSKFPFG